MAVPRDTTSVDATNSTTKALQRSWEYHLNELNLNSSLRHAFESDENLPSSMEPMSWQEIMERKDRLTFGRPGLNVDVMQALRRVRRQPLLANSVINGLFDEAENKSYDYFKADKERRTTSPEPTNSRQGNSAAPNTHEESDCGHCDCCKLGHVPFLPPEMFERFMDLFTRMENGEKAKGYGSEIGRAENAIASPARLINSTDTNDGDIQTLARMYNTYWTPADWNGRRVELKHLVRALDMFAFQLSTWRAGLDPNLADFLESGESPWPIVGEIRPDLQKSSKRG
jgi:hypothetical protein